jgi:hypothetical protein
MKQRHINFCIILSVFLLTVAVAVSVNGKDNERELHDNGYLKILDVYKCKILEREALCVRVKFLKYVKALRTRKDIYAEYADSLFNWDDYPGKSKPKQHPKLLEFSSDYHFKVCYTSSIPGIAGETISCDYIMALDRDEAVPGEEATAIIPAIPGNKVSVWVPE